MKGTLISGTDSHSFAKCQTLAGIASSWKSATYNKENHLLPFKAPEYLSSEQRQVTLLNYRRSFHSSPLVRENASVPAYHFDTFKFVRRLEEEGFTLEQSEAIMTNLREVIDERYIMLYYRFHITLL